MVPIHEQGDGKGIGYSLEGFTERFDAICAEHVKRKRAASFAFLFYDRRDEAFRQILKDQGVFAKLDRLTNSKISLFYLHAASEAGAEAFNSRFLERLGLTGATLPCVVFFRFREGAVENPEAICLDQANLIHGFHELYGVIEERIGSKPHQMTNGHTALRWIKVTGKFLGVEAIRGAIREGLQYVV